MQYFCSTYTRFNQTFVHQVLRKLNDMTACIISGLLSSKHNSKDILGKIFWIWFMLEFRLTLKRSIIGIAKPVNVLWYVCCNGVCLFVSVLLCFMYFSMFYLITYSTFPKLTKKNNFCTNASINHLSLWKFYFISLIME